MTPTALTERDAGLTRAVGPLALAATTVSLMVGGAIFAVPADLSRTAGSLAPAAVLLCALASGAVGFCLAASGSRVPSSGGLYASIEVAFGGGVVGFVTGVLFAVSNVLASGAICAALADAIASVAPPTARAIVRIVAVVALVAGIGAINMAGIARGARLVGVTTVLKLAPLLLFLCVGVFAMKGANFARPTAVSAEDMGRATLLMLFAFQGFECGLNTGGEVREPAKTIPRALFLGIGAVAVLYAALQLVAQGILGQALAHSSVPLADAMAAIHPALRFVMLAGAAVSMFGWMTADLMTSPRILFALGRDGSLPSILGRLNGRQAPFAAIACYGLVEIALALSGKFADLAEPAALTMGALYIAACVAAWELDRRDVREASGGPPRRFRGLGLAVLIGSVSMLVVIIVAPNIQILGLFALTGAAALLYLVKGLARRRRTASVSDTAQGERRSP